MNLQIFGRKKGHDVKKAVRFFQERGIPHQFIDLDDKDMSRREMEGLVRQYTVDELIDRSCKDQALLAQYECVSPQRQFDFLLEHQQLLRTPIVRNSQKATIGVQEAIWKLWLNAK